jgi:hypothetical protein
MSNYREMLEEYRDVDIEDLMAGLTEEELLVIFVSIFSQNYCNFHELTLKSSENFLTKKFWS